MRGRRTRDERCVIVKRSSFVLAKRSSLVERTREMFQRLGLVRINYTNMWDTIVRYYFIDWIALVLNALAIYLLGKKKKIGFSLGVVANIAWIIFGILAHSMATVVACTIFVVLNIKGWWNWTREQVSVKAGVDDDTPIHNQQL